MHTHTHTHTHTQHGWQVILVPNPAIKAFPSAPYSSDDFLAYAELGVEAGVALFEMYGVASPLSMAADGNGLAGTLGTITATERYIHTHDMDITRCRHSARKP